MLALAAVAWLVFARLILFGFLGYAIARMSSPRIARFVCSAVIDLGAIVAAFQIHPRCVWSAVAGIVIVEAFFALAPAT